MSIKLSHHSRKNEISWGDPNAFTILTLMRQNKKPTKKQIQFPEKLQEILNRKEHFLKPTQENYFSSDNQKLVEAVETETKTMVIIRTGLNLLVPKIQDLSKEDFEKIGIILDIYREFQYHIGLACIAGISVRPSDLGEALNILAGEKDRDPFKKHKFKVQV